MLSPGDIAVPLRHVLRHLPNVSVEIAEVTGFDLDRRIVHAKRPLGDDIEVPYDSLIVAGGASQSYFGHDELALFAPGMKTIDDALEVRRRVFGAFEMAESATDPTEREQWLTFVVVGAGPTGVELAGQIRELATRSLEGEFRSIDPASARVVLVDAGNEPLATFGNALAERAAGDLARLGVELKMGRRVTGVDVFGVDMEVEDGKERIDCRTVLWAAGVQASPLARQLAEASGAEVDRAGRIAVLPDLTLPGHPEVFAVGDMVTLNNLPGVAEVAMQGSLHAANTIARRRRGDSTSVPYRYRDLGSIATIGRFRAIVSVGDTRMGGFPAWLVWFFVHIAFLNGAANRASAMVTWARSMVGRTRRERVFSVAHTGGDLSSPPQVRAVVAPNPFPASPTSG
jgi:NADH dehydrogenase